MAVCGCRSEFLNILYIALSIALKKKKTFFPIKYIKTNSQSLEISLLFCIKE